MTAQFEPDERLLNTSEREMVTQAHSSDLANTTSEELKALGRRLRTARDRAQRIASQQNREIRGKADPRGTTPVSQNAGSVGKHAVLAEALALVTEASRKLTKPS